MSKIWNTIRGYVWWTHPRGGVHYDVMVSLILLFIFLTPRWINFKDKPIEPSAHPTGVVVLPEGNQGFLYEVDARAVKGQDDAAIREDLLKVIEPIAGEVEITRYDIVRDSGGRPAQYRVHVQR
ncbi:MAG TPA: hypothetical protein VFU76_16660 [Terriglobales bacterium]|nr:hypothetical protein [Terriglobales bacterium]